MIDLTLIKILLPWITAFLLGFLLTPYVIRQLHYFCCWKKRPGNSHGMGDNQGTPIFNKLHGTRDVAVPRMGGLVIVLSVCITVSLFWLVSYASSGGPSGQLDFLSRGQTWLPFVAFVVGALMGFVDDILTIGLTRWVPGSSGLPLRYRLIVATMFAIVAAYWFYIKLGVDSVFVPFYGELILGALFVPFFVATFIAVFATSNIDGLDGLSGGVMAIVFSAFGFIAYFQDQIDISAFCFVVVGAILSFLWFNVPPAQFYMTEVGYNALSFSLTIVAFMTDKVLLLPVIALCLFITEITTIIQIISKKFFGKKIFLVAPIHHHFEAIGWTVSQVVMRYWIVSLIAATLGVMLAFTA